MKVKDVLLNLADNKKVIIFKRNEHPFFSIKSGDIKKVFKGEAYLLDDATDLLEKDVLNNYENEPLNATIIIIKGE